MPPAEPTSAPGATANVSHLPIRRPPVTRPEFSIARRTGPWRDALRRRMLALADASGVLIAMLLVASLFGGAASQLFWAGALLPFWLILAKFHGLYDRDHRALRHLTSDELPSLVTWSVIGTALFAVGISVLADEPIDGTPTVALCLAIIGVVPVLRACARWAWRRGVARERAIIVGRGPLEAATRRKLELFSDMHVEVAATIDDATLTGDGDHETRLAIALDRASQGGRIDRIILAAQTIDEHLIAELVSFAHIAGIKLSVVPPARGMFGTAVRLSHVADLALIEYSTWDVGRSTLLVKRAIDVVITSVALLLLAPLMAIIAMAVRMDSHGPSFFRQRRAGKHGEPFQIIKFRTMTSDAEQRLCELVEIETLVVPAFKFENDPRVTRLGRFLRHTSLDELPQLLNVLRGDMSLVGPRPEQIELVDRYEDEHRFRLDVKPGVTGPMQVYGRGALRFDERLAVERDYVENYSLRRDLRILLLTASAVVGGGGAY